MKLAMVFPGQGSQSVGMLAAYAQHPVVKQTIDEASGVLGQDLWALVEQGPEDALALTVNTQPVMLAADVAVYRAWLAAGGVTPSVMAGHSLGEYPALVCGGAIEFADALPLVRLRAQAMQDAMPAGTGGIAAILGLDEQVIREVCAEAAQGQVVEPANLNAPGQIVIAGERGAVERAIEIAKSRGARRALMLSMSVPAHCSLMQPAGDRLRAAISAVAMASTHVPVIHNSDVSVAGMPSAIRDALVRQLFMPVRWIEIIEKMARDGVTHFVECGPGKVLQGLVKRIAPDAVVFTLSTSAAIEAAVTAVR